MPTTHYLLADAHFGDEAALRYNSRPFTSVAEMDARLIDNIHATVPENGGQLWLLGDAFRCSKARIRDLTELINRPINILVGKEESATRLARLSRALSWQYYGTRHWRNNSGCVALFNHAPLRNENTLSYYVNVYEASRYLQFYGHYHTHLHRPVPHGLCISAELTAYTPVSLTGLCAAYRAGETLQSLQAMVGAG